MIGIRKSLDLIFTRRELKILDDIMPEMTRHQMLKDAEVGWGDRFTRFFLGPRLVLTRDEEGADVVLNEKISANNF